MRNYGIACGDDYFFVGATFGRLLVPTLFAILFVGVNTVRPLAPICLLIKCI